MADNNTMPVQEADPGTLDSAVIIYGIVADIALLAPILLYLLVTDSSSNAKYHQTYVNMLAASYGPMGIIWWIVLADDSKMAREALTGAVEMAGLGPFALLWVGYLSFLMSVQSGNAFGQVVNMIFAVAYFCINVSLVIFHWYLSPPIYAWLATAPLPAVKEVKSAVAEKEDDKAEAKDEKAADDATEDFGEDTL